MMVWVCTGREYLNTVLVVLLHGRADGPGTVMDCLASEPRQSRHCVSGAGRLLLLTISVRDEPKVLHPPHCALLPGPRPRLLHALCLSLDASPRSLAVSATLTCSASQPSLQLSRPRGFHFRPEAPGPRLPFRLLSQLTSLPSARRASARHRRSSEDRTCEQGRWPSVSSTAHSDGEIQRV